jgi:hypothetical protein
MRRIQRLPLVKQHHGKQRPDRRIRLVKKRLPGPRMRLILKAKLVQRLLPSRKGNPMARALLSRRSRLIRKRSNLSEPVKASTNATRSTRYGSRG